MVALAQERDEKELEDEIRAYVQLVEAEDSGPISIPYTLSLYMQVKETGHLLVSGGLLDQPDWLWRMVQKSGIIYDREIEEYLEEKEFEEIIEAQKAAQINFWKEKGD